MQKLEKCLAKNTTAKAAVDIALYDLYAKLQKKPLFRLLGEKEPELVKTKLETDLTISVNETEEMVRDSLLAVEKGFHVLKVKVGKGGAKDVERIREIRNAVGKDIVIRVDANQGWTREEAVSTITAMEDAGLGIELVEQPVSYHDFKGMQYVTAQVETPILADESVFSYEDAVRLMEEKRRGSHQHQAHEDRRHPRGRADLRRCGSVWGKMHDRLHAGEQGFCQRRRSSGCRPFLRDHGGPGRPVSLPHRSLRGRPGL